MSPADSGGILLDGRGLQGADGRRGIGRYSRGLMAGLADLGCEFEVLIDAGLPPPPALPAAVTRVHPVRRRWHGRLAAYEDAVALEADLRAIQPRLFHALRLALPAHSPCPVAVTVHDLIPWAAGGWRMAGERLRYRPARRLLARAELVLAVSEWTAKDCRRLAAVEADRIRVVPEGVDTVFKPPADLAAAGREVRRRWNLIPGRYLLFVGALDVRKDPRGLLAAWRQARQAVPELQLAIAGDPGRQAPEDLKGARLLGYLDDADLALALGCAGCLVFPSLYEGFGLPPLEAMACGCPVVAYRNSSLPEVVGQAGVLVATRDHAALGREAAALVVDPRRRAAAVKAGVKQAARFSWKQTAKQTMAAYRSLAR